MISPEITYALFGAILGVYHYNRKIFWIFYGLSLGIVPVAILIAISNLINPQLLDFAFPFLYPVMLVLGATGALKARKQIAKESYEVTDDLAEVFE